MAKKKKLKQLKVPMRYNPGTAKFEPDLPLSNKKNKIKIHWIIWIIILIAVLCLGYILISIF